jgi:hypothetical protein
MQKVAVPVALVALGALAATLLRPEAARGAAPRIGRFSISRVEGSTVILMYDSTDGRTWNYDFNTDDWEAVLFPRSGGDGGTPR